MAAITPKCIAIVVPAVSVNPAPKPAALLINVDAAFPIVIPAVIASSFN